MKNVLVGFVGTAGSGKDTTAELFKSELFKRRIARPETYPFSGPLKDFVHYMFQFPARNLYDQNHKEEVIEFAINKGALRNRFDYNLRDMISLLDHDDEFCSVFETIEGREIGYHEFMSNKFKIFMGLMQPFIVQKWWQKLGFKYDRLYFKTSGRVLLQIIGTEFVRDHICKTFWADIAPKSNAVFTDVRFQEEADAIKRNGGVLVRIINQNQTVNSKHSSHASEQGVNLIVCDHVIINPGNSIEGLRQQVVKLCDSLGFVRETAQ